MNNSDGELVDRPKNIIEFSNAKAWFILKIFIFLNFVSVAISVTYWFQGTIDGQSFLKGLATSIVTGFVMWVIYQRQILIVKLLEDNLEIKFPGRRIVRNIPYSDIRATQFDDIWNTLTLILASGEKIKWGSTVVKVSGEFSKDFSEPTMLSGETGDRQKLEKEISFRVLGSRRAK
ncbi:hypothetical protein D3C72_1349120 [compost metagenome]